MELSVILNPPIVASKATKSSTDISLAVIDLAIITDPSKPFFYFVSDLAVVSPKEFTLSL